MNENFVEGEEEMTSNVDLLRVSETLEASTKINEDRGNYTVRMMIR